MLHAFERVLWPQTVYLNGSLQNAHMVGNTHCVPRPGARASWNSHVRMQSSTCQTTTQAHPLLTEHPRHAPPPAAQRSMPPELWWVVDDLGPQSAQGAQQRAHRALLPQGSN